MALLLGQYDVRGDNTPVPGFQTSQRESLTRTISVLETELGVSRQVHHGINLSLGWLFQAWTDLGTSGGTFGGFFAGADDANIMSFDGLFARAEFSY